MKKHHFSLFILLPYLSLITSCGSGSSTSTTASPGPVRKSLSERINEQGGYKQDSKGNWVAQSSKRSSYETVGQDPNFSGKDYAKKEYKAGEYAKQSFWGNKEYDRKSYTGNTDGSRFQKASALQGKGAREVSQKNNLRQDYQTDDYVTSAAQEAGKKGIPVSSNDLIENRQKVFQQPEVIDWREQRNMSMEQSKSFLGR